MKRRGLPGLLKNTSATSDVTAHGPSTSGRLDTETHTTGKEREGVCNLLHSPQTPMIAQVWSRAIKLMTTWQKLVANISHAGPNANSCPFEWFGCPKDRTCTWGLKSPQHQGSLALCLALLLLYALMRLTPGSLILLRHQQGPNQ